MKAKKTGGDSNGLEAKLLELAELKKELAEKKQQFRQLTDKNANLNSYSDIRSRLETTGTVCDTGIKAKCVKDMSRRTVFEEGRDYAVFSYDATDGLPTRHILFDMNGMPWIFGSEHSLVNIGSEKWGIVREHMGRQYNMCEFKTSGKVPAYDGTK